MAEVNVDENIASEDKERASGDVAENVGASNEGAGDDNNNLGELNSNIDDENTYLADRTTDTVKEEGEDLRQDGNIPEGVNEKKSPSDETDSPDGQMRKKATAVIVGQNHKFAVRSRYRRASTGSCHDLCKYGHKHDPEKKITRPPTIREARPLTGTVSGDTLAKPVQDKDTKNKAPLRRLSLPDIISEKDPSTQTAGINPSKRVSLIQSKLKRIPSETKPASVPTPGSTSSRTKIDVPSVKKADQSSKLHDKSSRQVKEIKTQNEGSNLKVEKEIGKEPVSNSPRTLLKKSPSMKARLYRNLRSFSRSRFQKDSEEPKTDSFADVPEKSVHINEPKASSTPAEKASKSSASTEKLRNTRRKSGVDKIKGAIGIQRGTRVGLASSSSPSASTSASCSVQKSSLSQRGYQRKVDSEKTKQNGQAREENGSKTNTPRAKANLSQTTKTKRTGVSRPEEKDISAWKVKFKRGTVVNLPIANNSPRKLRFKRGRVLGEDQNAKAEAEKSSKKKEDISNEPPDTEPESEKVRLRRQEASSKKDNVDMNNVIEETASKLVKTRKSKVKALVGAFETVMSFRDRKPLVEASAS